MKILYQSNRPLLTPYWWLIWATLLSSFLYAGLQQTVYTNLFKVAFLTLLVTANATLQNIGTLPFFISRLTGRLFLMSTSLGLGCAVLFVGTPAPKNGIMLTLLLTFFGASSFWTINYVSQVRRVKRQLDRAIAIESLSRQVATMTQDAYQRFSVEPNNDHVDTFGMADQLLNRLAKKLRLYELETVFMETDTASELGVLRGSIQDRLRNAISLIERAQTVLASVWNRELDENSSNLFAHQRGKLARELTRLEEGITHQLDVHHHIDRNSVDMILILVRLTMRISLLRKMAAFFRRPYP